MSDVRDIVSAQLEVVAATPEDYIQAASVFGDLIGQSAKTVQISRFGYRHPIKLYMGGASAKVSFNEGTGGVFPVGTMGNFTHLTGAYFTGIRSYRIPDEAVDTSSTEGQSRINALALQIADAMIGQAQDDDIFLHTSGNGILTNSSSASASTTSITFAGATDYLRTARLRPGMTVDVWDTTLATKRAVTGVTITAIDQGTGIVTLSPAVTGMVSTDVLAYPGLDAYGPATPTSYSSTYPQTGASWPQFGIGGDSWRHGILYANAVTTTDYFYGRLKSTRPEFLSNRVNAASNGIDWAMGRILQDKVTARFGSQQNPGNIIGLANSAQFAAIEDLDIAASKIQVEGDLSVVKDLAAFERKAGRAIGYCGMRMYQDPRQAQDRIDYVALDAVYKVQATPTGFVDGGDSGKYLFRVRDSGGQPVSALEFYVKSAFDWFFAFPGRQGFIDTLKVDSRWL